MSTGKRGGVLIKAPLNAIGKYLYDCEGKYSATLAVEADRHKCWNTSIIVLSGNADNNGFFKNPCT